MFLACLLSLACQAGSARADVVRLDVGTELIGTITRETADYIEIRVASGAVVGFDKSRTTAILREATVSAREAPPEVMPPAGEERWNLLHDGAGVAVGWLHETRTFTDDGETRFGEEWRFGDGEVDTELTVLEVVGAGGVPISAFYHERTRPAGEDRVLSERLVHAVMRDGRLLVSRRTKRGNSRTAYEVRDGMRFPLELRDEFLHAEPGRHEAVERVVFDPGREEFVRCVVRTGSTRQVLAGDARTRVRLLEIDDGLVCNTTWLGADRRPVRREVNGPALVAVPETERRARGLAASAQPVAEAAFRAESGGRFGLWLPNPMWEADPPAVPGEVTAHAALHGGSASLVLFDQVDPGVLISSAADTVLRWLQLVHPDFRVHGRSNERVRGRAAERISGSYGRRDGNDRVEDTRCDVYVVRVGEHVMALCCEAPTREFGLLEPDFRAMLRTIEPYREGFAPEPRGALALRSKRR